MKNSTKRFSFLISRFSLYIVLCSLLAVPCSLYAQDILLRPKAFGYIPAGEGNLTSSGNPRYSFGGGFSAGIEFDFTSIWPNPLGIGFTAGLEAGITTNSLLTVNPVNVVIYSAGGVLSAGFFPLSRLYTRIDGSAGIYIPTLRGINGPADLYWRAGAEAGFRFTPNFILTASGGWQQFEDTRPGENPFNSGFYAGITAQISFQAGGARHDGVAASAEQYDSVYPAFLQLYQTNPVGTLTITNRENAEIRDVRVSFRASPYTSSEFFCGTIPVIQRGRSSEIDLLADFSPEMLRFIDSGRVLGEVIIRYRFLGQERTAISVISITTHNRNTITIDDIYTLSVFVSPTSPEILDFSKFIAGLARSNSRVGHNQNFEFAVWLYEGLRSYGIRYGETYANENEIQFPAETMAFRTGTSGDLAMLYAAALESIGVSTAIIRIGTDYIVAVNLGINYEAADTLFFNNDRVININNQAWVPVAMSSFNEGFIQSWTRAVVSLNETFSDNQSGDFVVMSDAWEIYPPAPFPALGTRLTRAESEPIISASNETMNQYIRQDITPLVWRMETLARANPSAVNYNRLGILLARAGRIAEAKANYERAASMGSVPAMTNRGNLALNERDYDTAERWFRLALQAEPGNSAALRGLERVEDRR